MGSNNIKQYENYKLLYKALLEYHRLVNEGKLIPRKNNIDSMYKIYPFNSN